MKLKYRLTRNTLISDENVKRRIIAQLEKASYNILNKEKMRIIFDDYTGLLELNGAHLTKVDLGEITIFSVGVETIVNYTYYISIWVEICLLSFVFLLVLFLQIYWIFLIVVPFIIQFYLRYKATKNQAELIMDYVAWNGKHDIDN